MNKKIIIGIVVVIVIVLVWWMMAKQSAVAPTASNDQNIAADSYDQQLSGLNETDINAEMKVTDAQLNQL